MKKYFGLLFLILICCSCTSPEERFAANRTKQLSTEMRQKQITAVAEIKRDIDKKFRRMTDPRAAVDKVRTFALQRLHDLTEAERMIISSQQPAVGKKYDDSEYSFTWKHVGYKSIEVVTTPPPCEPIAVYRVNRVYYP